MSSLRALAGRAKRGGYRLLTIAERFAPGDRDPLLPPAHLRAYYYRTPDPEAFARACRNIRVEVDSHGLRAGDRILDVGCGIGNLAIALTGHHAGTYDGVDVHREAVTWCRRAITPRHPAFRFHHADLASSAYNRGGREDPTTYRFPFPDRSFDFIFLASVFTHMMPAGVEHYLREIARLLDPGGIAVASYFLLTGDARRGIAEGRSFLSFGIDHPSGVCLLHDRRRPEAAVAIDEAFVRRAYGAAGLEIRNIRRGDWWNGRADDQDVISAGLTS